MHPYEVLRRPLLTEKSSLPQNQNKYVFEVVSSANKLQIKEAVEMGFNVAVVGVNVMTVPGKPKRWGRSIGHTAPWKKAIVTLKVGDKIEFFQGL